MSISPVGGTTNSSSSSITTLATSYSPTAGNIVIFTICPVRGGGNHTSAMSVRDNSSNSLTGGPFQNSAPTNNFDLYLFYYTASAGVTGFTASWTGAAALSTTVTIEEYSSVLGGVNPAGASVQGGASNMSVSLVSTQANSFITGSFGFGVNFSSVTSGNLRQSVNSANSKNYLLDNTAASSGSTVTLSASQADASEWSGVAVELLPNAQIIGGYGSRMSPSAHIGGCGIVWNHGR